MLDDHIGTPVRNLGIKLGIKVAKLLFAIMKGVCLIVYLILFCPCLFILGFFVGLTEDIR